MEWISVNDRLPSETGRYLTWDNVYGFDYIIFDVSYGEWLLLDGSFFSNQINDKVTHWMPVPKHPAQ